jgi:glucosamine-6-phosphate deaminase
MWVCTAVHRPQGVNEEERSFIVKIIRTKDYADMSRKAANIISAQVIMKPNCVLGLATGGTPVGIYEKLVERYNEGDLDFSEVTSVNLDEYRGLPKEHPESYWSFMHRNLFDHVNIDPAHTNLPDGTNLDAEAECKRYDEVIRCVGGVDLQLLGIGHDGHIGFNEPHDAFDLGTHCVDLAQETIEANKRFFDGNVDLVPKQAYTMGIRTIMQARKVLMVVNGAGKAEIVKKAFFGPVTPEVPASILQLHPDFILVADEEALSLI